MAVLQHLPAVSAVVVFDEETPAALFEALRPNVLIKGGDYKAEELVGYDQIIGDGGAVHIIDTLPFFLNIFSALSRIQHLAFFHIFLINIQNILVLNSPFK